MKHYNHITALEINEVLTAVSIDFESDGFEVEIQKITDLDNGDAIAPDLTGEITEFAKDNMYSELREFAADMQSERNKHYPVNYYHFNND